MVVVFQLILEWLCEILLLFLGLCGWRCPIRFVCRIVGIVGSIHGGRWYWYRWWWGLAPLDRRLFM